MRKIPTRVKNKIKNLVADGVIERETVRKVKQANPRRKIDFEIGDIHSDNFEPQFKTKHWDNEVNFSARLVAADGVVTQHDKKLAYNAGDMLARFYEKDTGDEDGGFEFDVLLPEKPKSNVLIWTIRYKELDFFYQPELSREEKESGSRRPENVVGSYAVYHKKGRNNRVGGNEYRTGKAFHIYRPYAEDRDGDRVWCELNIDTKKNVMTVTIPQSFLDRATYPVIVDPTFGYTTAGASNFLLTDNDSAGPGKLESRKGNSYSLATAGTLDSISFYLAGFSGTGLNVRALINTTDSTAVGSHGEVANATATVDDSSAGWHTATFSGESLAVDEYLLSVVGDSDSSALSPFGQANINYDSTTGESHYEESGARFSAQTLYDSPANPWVQSELGTTINWSIYATYTTTSTTGKPRIKLAGTFTQKPLKYKTGGSFVEKPVKIKSSGSFTEAQ